MLHCETSNYNSVNKLNQFSGYVRNEAVEQYRIKSKAQTNILNKIEERLWE